ncbi:MAG: aminopeptidase [Lacunisphaera sp.]
MPFDFSIRLAAYAELIVRTGLNLQSGQRLIIAEPYEAHGVSPGAEPLVNAIRAAAFKVAGTAPAMIEIVWSNPKQLREFALKGNWRRLSQLVAANAHKINDYLVRRDAVLFLLGSPSRLMDGIPPAHTAETRRIGNEYIGPVLQQLMQAATNWTAVPSPTQDWAEAVFPELPGTQRLAALWGAVFDTMRVPDCALKPSGKSAEEAMFSAWEIHLRKLQRRADELNTQRFTSLSYRGEGTDLTVSLPPEHRWCTAAMRTRSGIPFLANLPTEEVFTLPHKDSASGIVRVARPVVFGGAAIRGIELEFRDGLVVSASAKENGPLLHQLLDIDPGARRLGEVAIVLDSLSADPLARPAQLTRYHDRFFHQVLLDENAGNHIALGSGYGFCLNAPNPGALNASLIHLDLPIVAEATFSP